MTHNSQSQIKNHTTLPHIRGSLKQYLILFQKTEINISQLDLRPQIQVDFAQKSCVRVSSVRQSYKQHQHVYK